MKKRMEELLAGKINLTVPELIVSVSDFRLQIAEKKKYKGSFRIGASDGSKMTGVLTSDCRRIMLASDHFSGDSYTILFGIDTKGLEAGSRIEGNIIISCNLAERKIPVTAEIVHETVVSTEGTIRTLRDFTDLCVHNFREGFHLFTDPSFTDFLRRADKKYLTLYRGFSHNPVTYQHLEEFLIAAGRKQPVKLTIDRQDQAVYHMNSSLKDTLSIRKNNWGYIRIEAEAEGSFIEIEKKVITTDDFVGRTYELEFILNREKLHSGRNYGHIVLKTVYEELHFQIEADAGEVQENPAIYVKKRIGALYRDMLNLQLRRLDYRTWYEHGCQLAAEIKEADPENSAVVLFEAYLALADENRNRAVQLLGLFDSGSRTISGEAEEMWCLILKKRAGMLQEDQRDLLPLLRRKLQQRPDQYLYQHLLIQEDSAYEHASAKTMYELEQVYEHGCNSPFLYLEAWKMLNEQESLLRKLTPFYLRVLRFAFQKGILSAALVRRMAFLSGGLREFSETVYTLLTKFYDTEPHTDFLEAICKQIMKGDPYRKEYFRWYALAVEKELRITRLYEYYMETVPESEVAKIPRPIRMYFVYNNTLGEKKKALLYASVILNKDTDRTCYLNYGNTIRDFTLESLRKGRINEQYAILYQELLRKEKSPELAGKVAEILFTCRVKVEQNSIRNIVVCHGAMREEQIYPCRDAQAYVAVYGKDACLLFEDEKKRRFAANVSYSCTPLMDQKEIASDCMELGVSDTGLELYTCGEREDGMDVNGGTLSCFMEAAGNSDFTEEYRNTLRGKILNYILDHREDEHLLNLLQSQNLHAYASVDRISTEILLIGAGQYEKAFALGSEFGYEDVPEELILRLVSRMILKMEFAEDEELLSMAEYVFRLGKYDEIVLSYLRDHSMGTMEYMCELWKRVRGFRLETLQLEKRILMLAIFTGKEPEESERILESYILNQGQESVITAFLIWMSGRYFLLDKKIPSGIFRFTEKLSDNHWKMDMICYLALLKYYSTCKSLSGEQNMRAENILSECKNRNLRFAFFKDLPESLIIAGQLEDKMFVEERFLPGTEVRICYRLGRDEDNRRWVSEPFREVYPGVYSREFLLFYGETLSYYLVIRNGEEEVRTGEQQLTLTESDTEGTTRYKIINRMLAAKAQGDQERMEQAVQTYLWQEAFTDNYLQLM